MRLSIVVPTLNRREILAKTLPGLLKQDLPPAAYEVVVVSDGSTDGTVDFVRNFKTAVTLRVLDCPHRGLSAARNAGIEAANGELVLLLDDDMVCEPSVAGKHVAAHSDGFIGVVVGSLDTSPESRPGLATDLVTGSHQSYHNELARRGQPASKYRVWLAANFSAPRNLLLNHQGYDERFLYSEDQELAIRLWEAGVQFKFVAGATVYEIYSKTVEKVVASDAPSIGKSEVKLTRKHPDYRRISTLASLLGESRAKLLAWWVLSVMPVSPDLLLRIPCSIAERSRGNPSIQRLGVRLLHYRKAIAVMRSATCEVGSWQRVRREFAIRLPVLRYRHVNSAERFEAQVRRLSRRGYVGIAPSQWLAWVTMGAELPERPVLIAFDGAYADVADRALPILRRYSFSAAVHVVTGHIGGESKWDREEGQLPERLMTADQIVHWSSQGIEFGSASRTHRNLTDLDNETLAGEIEGSATDLEQVLGRRPCSFLYPYGAVNQAAFEQVRRSFEIGLGAVPGLNALSTNLHLMHTAEIKLSQRIVSLAYAVMFGRPTLLPLHEGDSFNASDTFEQHPGTFTRKVEI